MSSAAHSATRSNSIDSLALYIDAQIRLLIALPPFVSAHFVGDLSGSRRRHGIDKFTQRANLARIDL